LDDRRGDGGTNSTLRIKEQGMHLILNEHDDDDYDDDDECSEIHAKHINALWTEHFLADKASK